MTDKKKPIGVCLGWDGLPHLEFQGGTYLFGLKTDRMLYPEYFPEHYIDESGLKIGLGWPIDPETGEKLPIVDNR